MTAGRRYMQRTDDPHPVLAEITRFLQATGMSDAAFGSRALGDPCFVEDVRCGRDVLRRTERKVRASWKHAPPKPWSGREVVSFRPLLTLAIASLIALFVLALFRLYGAQDIAGTRTIGTANAVACLLRVRVLLAGVSICHLPSPSIEC